MTQAVMSPVNMELSYLMCTSRKKFFGIFVIPDMLNEACERLPCVRECCNFQEKVCYKTRCFHQYGTVEIITVVLITHF